MLRATKKGSARLARILAVRNFEKARVQLRNTFISTEKRTRTI